MHRFRLGRQHPLNLFREVLFSVRNLEENSLVPANRFAAFLGKNSDRSINSSYDLKRCQSCHFAPFPACQAVRSVTIMVHPMCGVNVNLARVLTLLCYAFAMAERRITIPVTPEAEALIERLKTALAPRFQGTPPTTMIVRMALTALAEKEQVEVG